MHTDDVTHFQNFKQTQQQTTMGCTSSIALPVAHHDMTEERAIKKQSIRPSLIGQQARRKSTIKMLEKENVSHVNICVTTTSSSKPHLLPQKQPSLRSLKDITAPPPTPQPSQDNPASNKIISPVSSRLDPSSPQRHLAGRSMPPTLSRNTSSLKLSVQKSLLEINSFLSHGGSPAVLQRKISQVLLRAPRRGAVVLDPSIMGVHFKG
jgi:hypothetical protein